MDVTIHGSDPGSQIRPRKAEVELKKEIDLNTLAVLAKTGEGWDNDTTFYQRPTYTYTEHNIT